MSINHHGKQYFKLSALALFCWSIRTYIYVSFPMDLNTCSVAPLNSGNEKSTSATEYVHIAPEYVLYVSISQLVVLHFLLRMGNLRNLSHSTGSRWQVLDKARQNARSLNRTLHSLLGRANGLHKHKIASAPQGAIKRGQLKKGDAYAA